MDLINHLQKLPHIKSFYDAKNPFVFSDETLESLAIVSAYKLNPKTVVIVKPNLYGAQRLFERISLFLNEEECFFYPSDESFRIEALASSPELLTQRVYILNKALNNKPKIIITHTAAFVRNISDKSFLLENILTLSVGQKITKQSLLENLTNLGYKYNHFIEQSLQYSFRGGVVDVFTINYENPIRIEYFGDEIESLRFFDLNSQRTIESIDKVDIFAASDLIVNTHSLEKGIKKLESRYPQEELEEILNNNYTFIYKYYEKLGYKTSTLLDYLDDYHLLIINQREIFSNYDLLVGETIDYLKEMNQEGFSIFQDLAHVLRKTNNKSYFQDFKISENDIELPLRTLDITLGKNMQIKNIVFEQLRQGYKVVFALDNEKQKDYFQILGQEWEKPFITLNDLTLPTHDLNLLVFPLKEGFELLDDKIIYYSSKEIFGTSAFSKTNYNHYKNTITINSYEDLEIGDYVVHDFHGVGKFLGIETKTIDEINKDYLKIAYQRNDVLYVPLEHFKLVSKFISKDGVVPRLSRLGSDEWTKTKTRIKAKIKDIAERLINLYTTRTKIEKEPCVIDDEWQIQFEKSFPYELTVDQKRSVEEIKKDMESNYPMDRLLCGDVGYGKTEVAFIAAFKAIMSGKQVAFLCPTTLLANQHYERALERFKDFPINIGILSRFTTTSMLKDYLKNTKSGQLNLVIGTHRLLSKDVKFENLGLLIVDEEQRFGVEHKEKIKELKQSIDVLTLSATPIPRTLQMALVGLRSLSQIDTPPLNRLPIQTYVIEKNPRTVKEVIKRELARGGQVFYLHNLISRLGDVANNLMKDIPGAKIIVVHGRMSKEAIESAMLKFINKEADIMVATTIIENGIDLPNVNTIIIDNADHFGLSQLYQIKGRVGRGDRLAYAYLMYQQRKNLSEVAYKRLKAIKEFTELGSGYKIALRDLSIRGAGDILGAEQAGFIDLVGMDMYIHLLQTAIEEQKTGKEQKEIEINRPIQIDAYIPSSFPMNYLDKIDIYKQIDSVDDVIDLSKLENKINDVYGQMPINTKLLLEKRKLEINMKDINVDDINDTKTTYEIILHPEVSKVDRIGVILFMYANELSSKDIELTLRKNQIRMKFYKRNKEWLIYAQKLLAKTSETLKTQNV